MKGRQKRVLLGMFAVWFLYALLFTPSGDDMERIQFLEHESGKLLFLIPDQYLHLNGRVIGNFLSFALMEPAWLRALVKALCATLISHSLWKLAGLKSTGTLLFTFFLVTALPRQIHVQVYNWSAGFYNYVIPMAILLWFAARFTEIKKPAPWQGAMAGFASCLFVEHVTVFLAVLAVGIIAVWKTKQSGRALLPFAFGVLAGTLLMFASPVYHTVLEGDDFYRRVPMTFESIEFQLFKNLRRFGPYVLMRQLALPVLLFGAVFALLKERWDRILWSLLFLAMVILFLPDFNDNRFVHGMGGTPWLTVFAWFFQHLAVLAFLYFRVVPGIPQPDRNRLSGALAAWAGLYVPLLIVQPIGPRNYYAATLAYVLVVLLLLKHTGVFRIVKIRSVSLILLAGLLVWRGGIHFSNTRVYLERDRVIREAMQKQAHSVMLEPFPYLLYMHGSQTEGLEHLYYYRKPGDLYFYIRP